MKLTLLVTIGAVVVMVLSGCAVKAVDGSTFQLEMVNTENRFYQGVYTGCIQTLVMQSRSHTAIIPNPNLPSEIARQCMIVATLAVKSDSHTIRIPGWPGLQSMREIIEQIERKKENPGTTTF